MAGYDNGIGKTKMQSRTLFHSFRDLHLFFVGPVTAATTATHLGYLLPLLLLLQLPLAAVGGAKPGYASESITHNGIQRLLLGLLLPSFL